MKTFLILTLLLAGPALARELPVEIQPAAHAALTAQTRIWGGRLYVSGVAKNLPVGHKPADIQVEVKLLDAAGRTLASATDDVDQHSHPRTPHGKAGRYVVSFPASLARDANMVRVIIHDHAHEGCEDRKSVV